MSGEIPAEGRGETLLRHNKAYAKPGESACARTDASYSGAVSLLVSDEINLTFEREEEGSLGFCSLVRCCVPSRCWNMD